MNDLKSHNVILVVPDRHLPYQHVYCLKFIRKLVEVYNPDVIVDLGDEVDAHAQNFHQTPDPDLPYSASSELKQSIEYQKGFYEVVGGRPTYVCNSNHGSLYYRKLKANGIPLSIAKPWKEVMEAPDNFQWADRWILKSGDKTILFQHSIKSSAIAASKHKGMCTVQGHFHSKAEIQYWQNDTGGRFWGATVGCLVDENSLAMAYGKLTLDRPVLGAMVIIDGVPILIPMPELWE